MSLAWKIASRLRLSTLYVEKVASSASHRYKTYTIPKRSGGTRTIHHPSKGLKAIQRALVAELLGAWPVHDAAMAYRKGRSIVDNARVHAGSAFLLRMDVESFFPSIKSSDLALFASANPNLFAGLANADLTFVARVVFRNGELTIGAPTSPVVSNALCYELDRKLAALAVASDAKYTRYADDLFFSTSKPDVLLDLATEVEKTVAGLDYPNALKINHAKTRHASKRGRRRVTGIVLGSDGQIHLGRWRKRWIRGQIHRWGSLSPIERTSLAGMLAFAQSVDPTFINALVLKYGLDRIREARQLA